jgi:hypothetical protein
VDPGDKGQRAGCGEFLVGSLSHVPLRDRHLGSGERPSATGRGLGVDLARARRHAASGPSSASWASDDDLIELADLILCSITESELKIDLVAVGPY